MKPFTPEQLAARIAAVREGAAWALAQRAGCPVTAITVQEIRTITVPVKLVAPDGQSVTIEPIVMVQVEHHGPDCGPCCPHRPVSAAAEPVRPMGVQADGHHG